MDTSHADVVVIGGANVDVKCRTRAPAVLHTSNPGHSTTAPGGVARNIAENLARLDVSVALVSAIGRDRHGEIVRDVTGAAGVDLHHVVRTDGATGTYTAVLDRNGELVVAVADMTVMEALTPRALQDRRMLIARARFVVLDCNLHEDALACALEIARDTGVPVIVDPVSVPKANRLRAVMSPSLPIFTVTPNVDELDALGDVGRSDDDRDGHATSLGASLAALHARGVEHVWLRLGSDGSMLSTRGGAGPPCDRIAAQETVVLDVTGAGDAMTAGYVYALLRGGDACVAARYGHAAAAIAVASERTVSPAMTARTLGEMVALQGQGTGT